MPSNPFAPNDQIGACLASVQGQRGLGQEAFVGGPVIGHLKKVDTNARGNLDYIFEIYYKHEFEAAVFANGGPVGPQLSAYLLKVSDIPLDLAMAAISDDFPFFKNPSSIAEGSWYLLNLSTRDGGPISGKVVGFRDFMKGFTDFEDGPSFPLTHCFLWLLPLPGHAYPNVPGFSFVMLYNYQPGNLDALFRECDFEGAIFPPGSGSQSLGAAPPSPIAASPRQRRSLLPFYPPKRRPVARVGATLGNVQYTISTVGVMDIGTGGCNLLISNDVQSPDGVPMLYYDLGAGLSSKTHPPRLCRSPTYPNPPPQGESYGPIWDNQTSGANWDQIAVILSHWDMDHWQLGEKFDGFKDLFWLVPFTIKSKASSEFIKELKMGGHYVSPNLQQFQVPNATNVEIVNLAPHLKQQTQATSAEIVNNSGLVLVVNDVPFSSGKSAGSVLMTGDASCGLIAQSVKDDHLFLGLVAVHHGSDTHGAANNLPAPRCLVGGKAETNVIGRLVYSYGKYASPDGQGGFEWQSPYDFPKSSAVNSYQQQSWSGNGTDACSSAEGSDINNSPAPTQLGENPPYRGNIFLGQDSTLAQAFNETIFSKRKYHVQ